MTATVAGVLLAGDMVSNISEGVQRAAQAVDSGAALARLDALVKVSQEFGQRV